MKRVIGKEKILGSFKKSLNGFLTNLPIILGVLLLVIIIKDLVPIDRFIKDNGFSVLLADLLGSVFAGNPINSYIIAHQLGNLQQNIVVISTFLVSWVTVGFVQIPAEIYFFGKRFTFVRNILSFLFAIVIGYVIYLFYFWL